VSSSTSSSELERPVPGGTWGLTFALAVVLFALGIGLMEWHWRRYGLVPTVDDSQELWSAERDRVYPGLAPWSKKKLILVGGSRLLCDADLDVLEARLPDYDVVQLSVIGATPVAEVRDLADDERVRGASIVIDVAEHALERVNWHDQQAWVAHYQQRKNLAGDFEIRASAFLRSKLVVANAIVGFSSLMAGHVPKRDYVRYGADRSCRSDYGMVDAAKARRERTQRVRQVYGETRPPDPASWLEQAQEVEAMARKLASRDNKVAFFRPPTTGDHWKLDSERYPPPLYWDAWEKVASVPAIHFQEERGLDQFDAPDGSHLDVRDLELFSECFVDALQRHGIVEGSPPERASRCEVRTPPQ
jgi:hypothetical protein